MPYANHSAHFIAALRKQRGYSRQELADAIGKPLYIIGNLERGATVHVPDPETLSDLAAVLGCSSLDLLRAWGYDIDVYIEVDGAPI